MQAEALVRSATLMKEEIKSGFRGAKGLGKTSSLLSQIRSRATTVSRRLQRKPDYSSLNRDLEKLVKLTRQLEGSCQELLSRAAQDGNGPATEAAVQVTTHLAGMSRIADSMWAIAAESSVVTIPEYDPEVDFAPQVSPTQGSYDNSGLPPAKATPRPATQHSVLVK